MITKIELFVLIFEKIKFILKIFCILNNFFIYKKYNVTLNLIKILHEFHFLKNLVLTQNFYVFKNNLSLGDFFLKT